MCWPHEEFEQNFLGSIVTELHSAAFHQCEALLALILAEYQNRPDSKFAAVLFCESCTRRTNKSERYESAAMAHA
jgi:hypothetical protein